MFQTEVVQKIKTHTFMLENLFPTSRAVYEIMWENIVERGRPQSDKVERRMRTACWMTKATGT